jgi:hypothetical protein
VEELLDWQVFGTRRCEKSCEEQCQELFVVVSSIDVVVSILVISSHISCHYTLLHKCHDMQYVIT